MRLAEEIMEEVTPDQDRLRGLIEATLPIAKERAAMLGEMRSALERDDLSAALVIARQLCGLNTGEGLR